MLRTSIAAGLLLVCSACGAKEDPAAGPGPDVPKTRITELEKAMRAIPPQRRDDFQKAVACENRRRVENGDRRLQMTAQGVRDMLERLAREPTAAIC